MNDAIKKGVEIRNKFGSSFAELEMLRKGIWAVTVLNDKALSFIKIDHVRKFNDYDVARAEKYQNELIEFNKIVENMLEVVPAEQDPELNPEVTL